MDQFISELHYYIREKLWHSAIKLCTEELQKGKDPYISFWRSFANSKEGNLIESIRDCEPLQNYQDFQYSSILALITYHNMYSNPDGDKINQLIEKQLEIENSANKTDILNAMRFFTYLEDDEKFNDLYEKYKQANGPSDGTDLIIRGWKYALDNNISSWKEGKSLFERFIQENGNENIDVIFGGLKCLERLKSYEEILDTFKEILKMYPNFLPLHIERVKIYLIKNDFDNANDYINSRFSNCNNFELYKILAICSLMQDGDFKQAQYNLEKMWDLMLKDEPKNPDLYYITAKLFLRTCDKNQDILNIVDKMNEKALEFYPNNPDYLLQKGYIELYNGNYEKAKELFGKCSEIDPSNRESSVGLVYCKIIQSRFKEALDDINFLKEMIETTNSEKNSHIIVYEAICKYNLGTSENEILKLIKEALKIYIEKNKSLHPYNKYQTMISTDYDFLLEMADVLMNFYNFENKINPNNIPDTLRQAQRILSLLKKNKYLLSGLLLNAKLYYLQFDNNQALNIVNEVLNIDNKNLDALMLKALICMDQKDFPKAKEVINDAMIVNLQETKENSSFLTLKSKMELGLNDIENSQKNLNLAIANFDKTVASYNPAKHSLFKLTKKDKLELMKLNIDILLKLGKTEEAQSYMNQLVVEFQDLGDELLMLHSDLALKTGDLKKAVNLLRKVETNDESVFKKSRIKLAQIYLNEVMDRRLYTWCFDDILEKYPTFDNLKLAANALMEINAPDKAVEYYKNALKIKNDMEVMRDLGRALTKTHDYKEVIEYYMEASKIDERAINNQTVVNFWEMMNDYLDLLFLLTKNDNSKIESHMNKVESLKKNIEENIEKLNIHLKKYDDFHLRSILSKFKFMKGKVLFEIYKEKKDSMNKKDIFKSYEEAVKIERDVLNRLKELKIENQINESKEYLSQIWNEIGKYYEFVELKIDSSEKAYAESVKYDNSNVEALFSVSKILMKKNSYNEASHYIDLLLHEDESNDDALALLVSVLNAKKNNESALEYLEQKIKKEPNSYHLIELYITILLRSGNLSNAKDILHKSERSLKYTYTPGLYYCKGLFYKYMGEINKALIEFSKAKTDEDYGTKCLEQILEIYINPDCDVMLIDLDNPFTNKGDKHLLNYFTNDLNLEAIQFLLRELKIRRDDEKTKVYETYAVILTKDVGKINEKINELSDILDKNKENLSVWIALIMSNLVLKKFTDVKTHLKIMDTIQLNIKYYTDYERGLLILAYLMMMTNNIKKAEEYCLNVVNLNKAQIKAYEFLAMIKDKEGKYEESCGYYEKAWEYSNKNNANIGYKLVVSYLNSKQNVKALNICNEIKRKFKEYPIDDLALQAKNSLNN